MALFEWIPAFLSIPLMIYISYLINRRGKTPLEPKLWPLVGMLPTACLVCGRAHDYITQVLTECGGTYDFKGPLFCNIDMLFTSDPANIHHIFNKNFSNYPKGPEFRKIFDVMGDGIFNADFELWEVHRSTTLSLLTGADFHRSLERIVWNKVETGLIPVLDHFRRQGIEFDLQDVFHRFAFDNICEVVLDYDPKSLCVDWPHIPCEKAFSDAVEPLLYRHIIPETVWKLQKWLRIGKEKKLLEAFEAFDAFISPHINLTNGSGGRNKLLVAFEKVYREKNAVVGSSRGLTGFLKDTSLSLLFAGRDTTSTCLTWLFYLIALNPSAESKILEEIGARLGMKDDDKKWRFFSAEESRELVYLHGAVCESLRLYPPLALEHKSPVQPDVLPTGHRVRKNTKIIVSFYSVGRMETLWGKDCMEFKPERWITARGGIKHEPSYKFPVFNVGPRMCLGKEMSFVQMKMVAAAIIYHYRIELVEGHPVVPRDSVILEAKHGLRVRLSRRNHL